MRRPAVTEPPVAFRAARAGDLERIVEIERDGFRHPWSREMLARELEHSWSRVVLAVEPGDGGEERVVGFVVYWLVHDEVHVLNVATPLEARRRGIGRALMLLAEDDGRRRGARLVTLEVRRSNSAALALYDSLEYERTGVRPGYYAEEHEDAIVMAKALA